MRRKPFVALVPALLFAALLASPAPVAAAGGATETGTTAYTVNVAGSRIDVRMQLRITNNTPPKVVSCGWYCWNTTNYYYNQTQIAVEAEAGGVKASSNAGGVSQSVAKTDKWYRYIDLTYPKLYYADTRVITVTYSIDGAPRAKGDYRAVKSYLNLCAVASGYDSGALNVVVPVGYDITFYAGKELTPAATSGGLQTYSSGTVSEPYKFWTCLDGSNSSALVRSNVTVAGQQFEIQSWPEDPAWKKMVESLLSEDITGLQKMNGLDLPGGVIRVREVGNSELGEYAGMYNSATKIAYVTEETGADVVAHELSHIWYNRNLFGDKWASEGLAGYSEQLAGTGKYDLCVRPSSYPGSGTPDLSRWVVLEMDSTTQDEQILDYQYRAACYIITKLAGDMGAANLKAVLEAGAKGEMAYQGATPNEKLPLSMAPLTAEAFLDLLDERGMLPAGVKDLDQAQTLLGSYGIFSDLELTARSKARAAYHELAGKAGEWKLPLAVRDPMTAWKFEEAGTAIENAGKIVQGREEIESKLSGFSFDGTELQTLFEGASGAQDLTDLVGKADQEVEAATVLADARAAESGGRNPLQLIGLLGTDLQPGLNQATDALKGVRPDEAKTAAQKVIDQVNGSTLGGILRLAVLLGLLVLIFVAFKLVQRVRRRSLAPALAMAGDGAGETPAEGVIVPPPAEPGSVDPPADPPA